MLDGELEMEELGQTLKQMKNGKCPGVAGFPAEFFKLFWGKLKYFILRYVKQFPVEVFHN